MRQNFTAGARSMTLRCSVSTGLLDRVVMPTRWPVPLRSRSTRCRRGVDLSNIGRVAPSFDAILDYAKIAYFGSNPTTRSLASSRK